MSDCKFCRLSLPDGVNALGVCPHGDAHTECCLKDHANRIYGWTATERRT